MPRFKAPAPAPPTPTPKKVSQKDVSLLVYRFDDLCRNGSVLTAGTEDKFLEFIRNAKEWKKKWQCAEIECQRLFDLLAEKENVLAGRELHLKQAKEFYDEEQKRRQKVETERDNYRKQVEVIKDLLSADGGKTVNNETLDRIRKIDINTFANCNKISPKKRNMNALMEESAESVIDASDLSFEESREDILGESRLRSGNIYKRLSSEANRKKRRSFSLGTQQGIEKLVTKTTVTVGSDGNAVAESCIETHPIKTHITMDQLKEARRRSRMSRDNLEPSAPYPPFDSDATPNRPVKRTFSNAGSVPCRPHCFQKKKVVGVERCNPCGKRIKFGKTAFKCRDCAAVCHVDCRYEVPLPCVANPTRTPTCKSGNFLADYAPQEPPMIPALLIHCVKEVELRGLTEVGIYRVSGNELEASEILDKFVNCKGGAPKLTRYEIHAVTSCIKKFLRSLKEPIIPLSLWRVFVDAANNADMTDAESELYQAISELPLPNRDTLAYLILHLKTVADHHVENKMTVDNLAMVMGPTIVGYSSLEPVDMMLEAGKQKTVMKALMGITSDYWSTFLTYDQKNNIFTYLSNLSPKVHFGDFSPHNDFFVPATGGPARRTRSKQLTQQTTIKKKLFQSPKLL